jgi:hypothetical protein
VNNVLPPARNTSAEFNHEVNFFLLLMILKEADLIRSPLIPKACLLKCNSEKCKYRS